MNAGRITLFHLLGFKVNVDLTWIFLAVFVTWSLAAGYFPKYRGYDESSYWVMGLLGAMGLFGSIIVHELSHSIVARLYGLPIRGITLFIFGGVAEMEKEPPSAKAEFFMAIAGPLASFVLAVVFYEMALIIDAYELSEPLSAVFGYLALLNLVLALFNMIPAFPLDGGRALRAAFWHWTGDMRTATRRAANIGAMFGLVLMAVGIAMLIYGNFIVGLWWSLIGLFLNNAARRSIEEADMRAAFAGKPVSRFMTENVITVPPHITLRELVEENIYQHHYDMFPVAEDGNLKGCVGAKEVRKVPRERWGAARVGDIMVPPSPRNTIEADTDALECVNLMRRIGASRLLVVKNGRLFGIVILKDMLELMALKIDLEGRV